jgi:arylsulfatase A-like enzyme
MRKMMSSFNIKYSRILMLGVLIVSCTYNKETTNDLPPPNIVWLVSEDNSMHYLKMFNDNGVATPHIESLATQGLTYTRAFSNAAVCSAARSTIISGCYGPRLASHYHRKIKKVPMPETVEMFPAYLKRAGYYTTNNSKEDYNFIKPKNVWDDSSNKASWRNRGENQPFFHIFNTNITHEGKLHFKQNSVENKPTTTDKESFNVQPNHPNTELFKYSNAFYRDKIVEMDNKMGEVINQLKEDGLYKDSFIFYYGDHGGVLPGSKGYLYETGLHVPMVVHVPEKYKHLVPNKIGSSVEGFVSFVDLGPTVLNLAGVEIPKGMDGKPFLGKNISLEDMNTRDETFSYADRFDEKYDMVRAVRKGKYKYVRNYQPFNYDGLMNQYRYRQLAYKEWAKLYETGELNEVQSHFYKSKPAEQLFDIEKDPFETKNLAEDTAHKKTVLLMRERLNSYMTNLPDLSFYPEHILIKNAFDNPEKFGQDHKAELLKYMNIADLSLSSFDEAKSALINALNSKDPWERYWGIIVCSTFGKVSVEFASQIKEIAKSDHEKINKVRALEYMGLVLNENPLKNMATILSESNEPAEALLILNSMVLMTDGEFTYKESFDFTEIPNEIKTLKPLHSRFEHLEKKSAK